MRACGADAAHEGVRPERRVRRPDQEGSESGTSSTRGRRAARRHRGRLLQPERRRPDEVVLRAGSEQPDVHRTGPGKTSAAASRGRSRRATSSARSGTSRRLPRSARARRTASPIRRASRPKRPASARRSRCACRRRPGRRRSTSRLLLDAGFGGVYYGWGNFEREPDPTHDLIRVTEQCAAGCAANGSIPGLVYRSQDFGTNFTGSYNWNARRRPTSPAHTA